MYNPLYISILYIYTSEYFINNIINNDHMQYDVIVIVVKNLLLTELIYALLYLYTTLLCNEQQFIFTEIFNVIIFIIIQDLWFYTWHRLFHVNTYLQSIHKIHHKLFTPFTAWHVRPLEHLIINIGSVIVPLLYVPIGQYTLFVIITLSIIGDTYSYSCRNSSNFIHFIIPDKRFSTIGICDYICNTYVVNKVHELF